MKSPTLTSLNTSGQRNVNLSWFPKTSSFTKSISSPSLNSHPPFYKSPKRISGPLVSNKIPIGFPVSLLTSRIRLTRSACSS